MTQNQGDHVDAGAMLRWIDGEASDLDRRAIDAHVAACAVCTRDLGALQDAARTVNRVLTDVLDVEAPPASPRVLRVAPRPAPLRRLGAPAPARRPTGRGWRIAASIALLLGALAAVPELRALVLETWRAVTGRRTEVQAVHTVPVVSEPEMRPIVEVTPADSFAVVFETSQAVGRVIVTAHDSATAIILSSDPQMAVMVLPSRVRIANQGSRADYQIIVPTTLDNLGVTVAGRRQPVIAGGDLRPGRRVVVPLQ